MSKASDPARWTAADAEDVPNGLGRLLRDARDDIGSRGDVAELAQRLSAMLGPDAGLAPGAELASEGGPGPASGASLRADVGSGARVASRVSRSTARWAIGAVATGGAIAGLWWALSGAPSQAPAVGANPAPAVVALPAPPGPAPALPASELPASGPPLTPSDVSSASAAPSAPAHRPRSALPAARGGEARLLERAQSALERRPTEALRLTREHAARFPDGALVQEREVIAIDALKRLGRDAAAKSRAAEFERRFRGSVHRPRLGRAQDTSAPGGGGAATLPP